MLEILLREQYEQDYKIFDHDLHGANRPLALVAACPKEDVGETSALYRFMWRYDHHGMFSKFGIPFDQFVDLPHDVVEMLFKVATLGSAKKSAAVDSAIAAAEKTLVGQHDH